MHAVVCLERVLMSLDCPGCGSDNVRRLSLVYEDGLHAFAGDGRDAAVALGTPGLGVQLGSSKARGTIQTAASAIATPPARHSYRPGLFLMIIALALVGPILGSRLVALALFLLGAVLLGRAVRYNRTIWPDDLLRWRATFRCQRCGRSFIPATDGGGSFGISS
ncbi:hypothetical protein [Novosphingobium pokkalii]|uniref:hypothetical protein n=1 Tax=Novosphingobium pokkalii TaxID=1770194 RepID=UPI0036D4339C